LGEKLLLHVQVTKKAVRTILNISNKFDYKMLIVCWWWGGDTLKRVIKIMLEVSHSNIILYLEMMASGWVI